ncbi:four helix bundle protein [Candidatus Falkowbacteria bacterium]|jgi:four helix bundle protein|nr:four helix bundle protein [Candidatus Falkowbacteria bacterium]MBT5503423.1 four helix bundle protein [Candidatus Falkowbacteria bacterium]MBT6574014.1 four helix bundle protein [Candidatus Falkowbacteria bacterium]MBT7348584.1 four helix bundle protein [Candidatus Falkowbacteria bacterium]MBT7500374.1 four helix bundle protein [Candidatus Falkowbacteria bacterium]
MNAYQEKLKKLMNDYVHFVYRITRNFPKQEMYSSVSQFRRAALSIILNYIEGYARRKTLVRLNHLEISLGSFKESSYLLEFSLVEEFISKEEYEEGTKLEKEIGAMLWTELTNLEKSIRKK